MMPRVETSETCRSQRGAQYAGRLGKKKGKSSTEQIRKNASETRVCFVARRCRTITSFGSTARAHAGRYEALEPGAYLRTGNLDYSTCLKYRTVTRRYRSVAGDKADARRAREPVAVVPTLQPNPLQPQLVKMTIHMSKVLAL